MAQVMNEEHQEYIKLLNLLAKANDSVEESSISDPSEFERLVDAHELANKFIGHALTILHLSRGIIIKDFPSFGELPFIDFASIAVLTRASYEAFLRFHLVFYAPDSKDERDFRYLVNKVSGIMERQNYLSNTFGNEKQKAEEAEELAKHRGRLESNNIYINLIESKRRRLFEGKESDLWRWNPDANERFSWNAIGINAGFSKKLAYDMYNYLVGCAHSGSLSVRQTTQALIDKVPEMPVKTSINMMNVITANMIKEYCALFSNAQDILNDSGFGELVNEWIEIGSRLDDV